MGIGGDGRPFAHRVHNTRGNIQVEDGRLILFCIHGARDSINLPETSLSA